MDGGSDWVALSRPFVAYVATAAPDAHAQKDVLVEGLNTIFKYTLLPAEVSVSNSSVFFHLLVLLLW
jgi:protein xylosyltransferase